MNLPEYLEFIQLFNEQKFFEAHEVLELLWRKEKGAARDFYQGLIQIAAVFVHLKKGTPDGAKRLFVSASQRLEKFRPVFMGCDLETLLNQTDVIIKRWPEGVFPTLKTLERKSCA